MKNVKMKTYVLLAAAAIALFLSIGEVSAEEPPVVTQDKYLTIVKMTDSNQFLAYSTRVGQWKKHRFRDNIKAQPVATSSVCAFGLSGDQISELVAVDQRGNWRLLTLPAPTDSDCTPFVSDEVAVYQVDGHVHAFSALTGTWDSIPSKSAPSLGADTVMVLTGDSIAMFSAETGRWATASLKGEK